MRDEGWPHRLNEYNVPALTGRVKTEHRWMISPGARGSVGSWLFRRTLRGMRVFCRRIIGGKIKTACTTSGFKIRPARRARPANLKPMLGPGGRRARVRSPAQPGSRPCAEPLPASSQPDQRTDKGSQRSLTRQPRAYARWPDNDLSGLGVPITNSSSPDCLVASRAFYSNSGCCMALGTSLGVASRRSRHGRQIDAARMLARTS